MLFSPNTFQVIINQNNLNQFSRWCLNSAKKQYKRTLFISCFLSLCLCILAPNSSIAYYPEAEKDFFFIKERSQLVWPQGDRKFAIYDNCSYSLGTGSRLPLITPLSNEFVPADIIIGNLPLTHFFRKNLMIEDYISNLLYANLRLKKLLEEYAQIQKIANELLHDIEQPGSYYDTAINNSDEQETSILSISSSRDSKEDEQLVMRLKQWEAENKRDKDSVRLAYSTAAIIQKYGIEDEGRVVSLSDIFNHMQNNTFQTMSYSQINGTVKAMMSEVPKNSDSSSYGEKKRRSGGGNSYYDVQLPWILAFPLKILRYLTENKLEAFLYFAILLIPGFIITASRSR